jgi:AmmeMemoRadiSam system protein A
MKLTETEKDYLLTIARRSIEYPLRNGQKFQPDLSLVTTKLKVNAATFVTLFVDKTLHGCIGSLKAFRSLVEDVVHNAYSAAFEDHRFPEMVSEDLNRMDVEISILSQAVPVVFYNKADLLSKITMNEDGLILVSDEHQATFLPSVWESLPEKEQFLEKLILKAGLPAGFWSDQIKISKYSVEKIS